MTKHADVAELADAQDLGSCVLVACRFDSCHPHLTTNIIFGGAELAQLAEHFTSNEGVAGSNPVLGIRLLVVKVVKLIYAPIAQLDRVSDYESEGCRFESY